MDMKEMVDKVKQGEPLYGTSKVSSYIQGVAARNSRYSELFIHVLPWINIVNHDQVSPPSPQGPFTGMALLTFRPAWCRYRQVLPTSGA